MSAAQVESTQIDVSARGEHYVPMPSWWSVLEVSQGFSATFTRVVAYFGMALRREESIPAAAILATQWMLEEAKVWYDSALTKGYLWHLPAELVDRLVRLHPSN